jgi:sec-independent protein translocase protein TatA
MLRNGLEPWHLLVLAIVVIMLFGSKKLPDTARALGKSMRILKSETKAMKDENGPEPAESESAAVSPSAIRTSAEAAAQPQPGARSTTTAH